MVVIVDYGMGNAGSIMNMLKKIGTKSVTSCDPSVINDANKIILPGVGSFDKAIERIDQLGLRDVLDRQVKDFKKPTLGICLGMQLLTRGSEEGSLPGLGWIKADTIKFPQIQGLKVPHMGWNLVKTVSYSPLTYNLQTESRFYFVHSYRVHVDNESDSILKCHYGIEFDAAVQHENIYGAQFHPEKSHKFGMLFLSNFSNLK